MDPHTLFQKNSDCVQTMALWTFHSRPSHLMRRSEYLAFLRRLLIVSTKVFLSVRIVLPSQSLKDAVHVADRGVHVSESTARHVVWFVRNERCG